MIKKGCVISIMRVAVNSYKSPGSNLPMIVKNVAMHLYGLCSPTSCGMHDNGFTGDNSVLSYTGDNSVLSRLGNGANKLPFVLQLVGDFFFFFLYLYITIRNNPNII